LSKIENFRQKSKVFDKKKTKSNKSNGEIFWLDLSIKVSINYVSYPVIDPPKLICDDVVELLISSSFNSELSELSSCNLSIYRGGSRLNKNSGKVEIPTKMAERIKPIHHWPTHRESPSSTGGSDTNGSTQWLKTFPPRMYPAAGPIAPIK